jgi:predicted ribosomally synthesized peptide with SipW-like signal peptide
MKILKSVMVIGGIMAISSLSTQAYYSSRTEVSNNQFATGTWPTTTTTITAPAPPQIVINEVYYDVAGDKGSEPNDEWIELYNNGDTAVSLKDWTITDNYTARAINANKSIPAHGFALISKDHSTWSLYWSVPSGVEIIELGQNIGNGLSNSGDRVILKNSTGQVIDQMSYGTDTSVFDPACFGVTEGHSLERSPIGHDSDQASDFIDQANPTPGS